MANDVYNRQVSFGDPISSDNIALTLPALNEALGLQVGQTKVGLLVQSLSMTYSQQTGQLYDLASTDVTTVVGRPTGQMQLNRAIGRRSISEFFYTTYGDACKTDEKSALDLHIKGGACGNAAANLASDVVTYSAQYALLTSTQISTSAQATAVVNEAMQLTFLKLVRTGGRVLV